MKTRRFISHASNHEDVVLARALRPDETTGFWIDVGAGDPVVGSATASFSQRGWHGVNIEPSPREFECLVRERPDDVNINAALGEVAGRAKLHCGPPEIPGSSTLVSEIAEAHRPQGESFTAVEVEILTLHEVVATHVQGPVDFLKIDVEGYEREVLAGADWSDSRRRVIVVAATIPNTGVPSHEAWEEIVVGSGYEFALFDGLYRFYARCEEPTLREALSVPANVLDNFVGYLEEQRCTTARASMEQEWAETRELLDRVAILEEELAQLNDVLGRADARGERANAEIQRLRHELSAVYSTRTFRYVAPIRELYASVRRTRS